MKKEIKKINIIDKDLGMLVEDTVRNFYIHTGRSPFKLKAFHGHIAKLVSEAYGSSYKVHSLGFDNSKEKVTKGSIYHKKADITVVNKYTKNVVAVYNIKFPFSSLSNNANNYFESSVGESTNFRLSGIKVYNLFFYFKNFTSNPKELVNGRINDKEMFRPFLDENSKDLFDLNYIYQISSKYNSDKMNPVFDLKCDNINIKRLNITEKFIKNSNLVKDIRRSKKDATQMKAIIGDELNLYMAIEKSTGKKYIGVNRSGPQTVINALRKSIGNLKADIEVFLLEKIENEEQAAKLDFYIKKYDTIRNGYNVESATNNTTHNTRSNEELFKIIVKSKEPWTTTIKKLNISYQRAIRLLQRYGNLDYSELRDLEKRYNDLLNKTDDLTNRILEQVEREKLSRKLQILKPDISRRDYEIYKVRLNIDEEKQEVLQVCEEIFGLTKERVRQICEIIEFELEAVKLDDDDEIINNTVIKKLKDELVDVFIKKENVKMEEQKTIESGIKYFDSSQNDV